MSDWVDQKSHLAEQLAQGECGGGYGDAIIVLSSVISGIAAALWPGERIDRQRFVQVWWTYSDRTLAPVQVSVPLLIEHLDGEREFTAADELRARRPGMFMPRGLPDDLVTTGDRVDLAEEEILSVTTLPLRTLREFTYPNLFYRHFRSAYVHEARVGRHGDEIVMSETRGDITYACFFEKPRYRINFATSWLASVTRSIWSSAREDVRARAPLPYPDPWWVTGSKPPVPQPTG